jgi:hypothetical protein
MKTPHVALRDFRNEVYTCCTQRRDALFDLVDALLTSGTVPSPVHLSLVPAYRRSWGSLYAALTHGRLDEAALRALLARQPLADGQPVYAVDCSVWVRDDAETSPERGFYYHPSRHSAGQPIVAGWSYQWLAQLSFAWDSWTAPLDVQRVSPTDDANEIAIQQIQRLCRQRPVDGLPPLFVLDAGYDPVPLSLGLAATRFGRVVARLCPPLRRGTHPALRQADAAVDSPPRPAPGASGPLDLAGHRRLYDVAPSQSPRPRPASPLGTAATAAAPDTLPRAAGGFPTPARPGHARQPAKTLWPLARTSEGPSLRPGATPSSDQEGRLTLSSPPRRPYRASSLDSRGSQDG